MGDDLARVAREGGHVVRYNPWPVILPVAGTLASIAIAVIVTGHGDLSWAASTEAAALFFRQTWLVARRRVALAIGPSGVYLNPTLGKPRQTPEFIAWANISALEITQEETDDGKETCVVVRGLRAAAGGEPGPRIAYRKVDGWRLDRWAFERAVREYGPRSDDIRADDAPDGG